METISIPLSLTATEEALKKITSQEVIAKKFEPIEFDLNSSFIQSEILLLDFLRKELKKNTWGFNKSFLGRLKSFKKFQGKTFFEYLDKCITVVLMGRDFYNIEDVAEEISINGKVLDLVLKINNTNNYIELSSITLNYYLEKLNEIEKNYFVVDFRNKPIYFEVIFEDEPAHQMLIDIANKIQFLVLNDKYPIEQKVSNSCEFFIDYLENRKKEKQIPREKVNDKSYLKSFRMNGPQNYSSTLAYKFSYKTVKNKIFEEIKKHQLNNINNVWLSLHTSRELIEEIEKDQNKINDLTTVFKDVSTIKGVLLFELRWGSVLEISYLFLKR